MLSRKWNDSYLAYSDDTETIKSIMRELGIGQFNDPEGIEEGEDDYPTHIITTDVYYVKDYDGNNDWKEEAVPEYEIDDIEDLLAGSRGSNFLYIEKGEKGTYEDGEFTTEEGSNTRLDPGFVKEINKKKLKIK